MKSTFNEFILYKDEFIEEKNDLYGKDSPLTKEELKDFFRNYLKFGEGLYGENFLYEKAVSNAEIEETVNRLQPLKNREVFSAYARDRFSPYENWHFYTDKTQVNGDELTFIEKYSWPMPSAKFDFPSGVRSVTLGVKMTEAFHIPLKEIFATTTGRYIEFRKGCKEIVKLYFSPDGKFIFKDGKNKPYHYQHEEICTYKFDKWFFFTVSLHKGVLEISAENKKLTFECKEDMPDNIFFGGGMQPVDEWSVKLSKYVDGENEEKAFFVKAEKTVPSETYLGEVSLPYALGTEKFKDKELVLRKTFFAKKNKNYILTDAVLDPGGYIAINGEIAAYKDDFNSFKRIITEYIVEGENHLEIVVFPRAPEVLFAWHRHDDYYNGWFCQSVKIIENDLFVMENAKISTLKICENTVDFRVDWKVGYLKDFDYEIKLRKVFPFEGEAKRLKSGRFRWLLSESFSEVVDVWSCESPNLYEIEISLFDGNKVICVERQTTGFRTIDQRDGDLHLNGKRIELKGGLNMQFLPPYENVPISHLCPSDFQICQQALAVKNLNGNCLRLHQLGYGTSDARFAEYCDRIGVLLIWTTRYIDSIENELWTDEWKQADNYVKQVNELYNHPSIIVWEGSNELHVDTLEPLDRIYDHFVDAVGKADPYRLLCPVSHLYYGGGIYGNGYKYYNEDGTLDELGNEAKSSFGWLSRRVLRSAHTYILTLGYGASWKRMKTQDWRWQQEMLDSKKRAYIVSEYAVIGRQNPNTPEAKEFINKNSYEFNDEFGALGFYFTDDEWDLSQAYQSICASVATKKLNLSGADGMLWCCLWGGANNASYLKPIVDFPGYKKFAYYALREGFANIVACNDCVDVLCGKEYVIKPFVKGLEIGRSYRLKISIKDEAGLVVAEKLYGPFAASAYSVRDFSAWQPKLKDGYYGISYEIEDIEG